MKRQKRATIYNIHNRYQKKIKLGLFSLCTLLQINILSCSITRHIIRTLKPLIINGS